MIVENILPFLPCEFRIKFAASRWEREGSYALRRAVFCEEQGIFQTSDRDETDDYAIPIVALSMLGVASDRVVGTVRIHEEAPGVWWGSRLAVENRISPDRRDRCDADPSRGVVRSTRWAAKPFSPTCKRRTGRCSVRCAGSTIDEIDLHGRPHLKMRADLSAYPPCATPELGYVALRKAA